MSQPGAGGPLVSVILPVYNGAATVREAAASILVQTFMDFELIVVDDASTDDTPRILASLKDPRLRVFSLTENCGRNAACNRAAATARGDYLAMLDADDSSLPKRLERQVAFLQAHPDIALCGGWARLVDEQGRSAEWRQPTEPAAIRAAMLRSNPFIHSTMMIRRRAFEEAGGFDQAERFWAADYDLYLRIVARHPAANIPEILAVYRSHGGARYRAQEQWAQVKVRWRALTRYGYPPWQAVYLASPLLGLLLPTRWKVALKNRLLQAGRIP